MSIQPKKERDKATKLDDLFSKGMNKFENSERLRILRGYYKLRKKVIYAAANDDTIANGSLRTYPDYENTYFQQLR